MLQASLPLQIEVKLTSLQSLQMSQFEIFNVQPSSIFFKAKICTVEGGMDQIFEQSIMRKTSKPQFFWLHIQTHYSLATNKRRYSLQP